MDYSEMLPIARVLRAGNNVCPRPGPPSTLSGELGTLDCGREGTMNMSAQGLLSLSQELSYIWL